ncbi:MAG: hypothetical protein ACJAZ3_001508 [Sphingobacteriales bacterium]|jgi:hypothetical protein
MIKRALNIDTFGFWASLLCGIHCAVFPILASFSVLGSFPFVDNLVVDLIIVSFSILIALTSFIPSYKKHGKAAPLVVFSVALCLLIIGLVEHHEAGGILFMVGGALLLATSHVYNTMLLKTA